ncbi:copper resistance protein B [Sphingomonas koreensis]|nr:copper resistance protein B [Sphingomonas koreensis]
MIRAILAATTALLAFAASPAAAQSMSGMQMPGMDMSKPMPAKKKAATKKAAAKKSVVKKPAAKTSTGRAIRTKAAPSAPRAASTPAEAGASMPGMDMSGSDMKDMDMSGQQGAPAAAKPMPGMDMSGASAGTMAGMDMSRPATGTDLPPGAARAPLPPADHYADRTFTLAAMDRARSRMMHEEGGQKLSQVMFNLAEFQVRNGHDGYRWDGEGWFGGDIDRLVVKSEGEGTLHRGVDSAEVQALYSRAIGPYFDLQAGVRHDFQPSPTQTYATIGIEGLAPYMFETEAALFLSTKGDILGRAEAWYDERITQRLILQPRIELNLAAQDVPEDRIGAGLSDAELGLRLRYEISRRFAPYVGVSYEAKTGRTATFARRDGEDVHATSLVLGIRTWF